MVSLSSSSKILDMREIAIPVFISGMLFVKHWLLRDSSLEGLFAKIPWPLQAAMMALMLYSIIMFYGDNRAFIYFQF